MTPSPHTRTHTASCQSVSVLMLLLIKKSRELGMTLCISCVSSVQVSSLQWLSLSGQKHTSSNTQSMPTPPTLRLSCLCHECSHYLWNESTCDTLVSQWGCVLEVSSLLFSHEHPLMLHWLQSLLVPILRVSHCVIIFTRSPLAQGDTVHISTHLNKGPRTWCLIKLIW